MNGYAADQLDQALEDVKVVVIPAGVPRKVRFSKFALLLSKALIIFLARSMCPEYVNSIRMIRNLHLFR